MRTITAMSSTIAKAPVQPTPSAAQRSPWHSPVPYLFGGLAAMLGLIAFALLILACSYWRLSGQLNDSQGRRDLEGGEEKEEESGKSVKVYEEKILVIMAGEKKPTFLATPVCAKISSFIKDENKQGDEDLDVKENSKEVNKDMDEHEHEQEHDNQAIEYGANSETQDSH
ncbi:hypothetical protein FNV43_RR11324 [Rhamnella rubrinervis]|uniref:Uncharacterized protein n=1 Tax=Rhamnella rubrinervis TaxID=2594499 RepID=A0A8K0H627_9ROSA|nr:hypothetical protein FNV43_RR11324 [Rhamnella rubrinervis]